MCESRTAYWHTLKSVNYAFRWIKYIWLLIFWPRVSDLPFLCFSALFGVPFWSCWIFCFPSSVTLWTFGLFCSAFFALPSPSCLQLVSFSFFSLSLWRKSSISFRATLVMASLQRQFMSLSGKLFQALLQFHFWSSAAGLLSDTMMTGSIISSRSPLSDHHHYHYHHPHHPLGLGGGEVHMRAPSLEFLYLYGFNLKEFLLSFFFSQSQKWQHMIRPPLVNKAMDRLLLCRDPLAHTVLYM